MSRESAFARLEGFLNEAGLPGAELLPKYEAYMDGILEWNEKVNLTAIRDEEEFVDKHYIDSLSVIDLPCFTEAKTVADVGTGGGFPGVPLAIAAPDKEYLLLDSLRKRLNIIDALTEEIGITGVTTRHGRAEDLGRDKALRDSFDVCVSRAVANLPVLCELCLPFVKPGGVLLAYKGSEAEEEATKASRAIRELSAETEKIFPVVIHTPDEEIIHNIIVIRKTGPTPKRYPRKAGIPTKEPLL